MPSPATVSLRLRLPKALHTELVKLAERELSSLNREIVIAVSTHLTESKRKGTR